MNALWWYGLWDRFTYKQLSLQQSKLNSEWKKNCKALEKNLKVSVYLYIFGLSEPYKDESLAIIPQGLPNGSSPVRSKCGGEWVEDLEFCKCEKSKIIYDSLLWEIKTFICTFKLGIPPNPQVLLKFTVIDLAK